MTINLKQTVISSVQLFVTPWAVAYQAPPSMGFSRQEYWSGLPFPSPIGRLNPRRNTVRNIVIKLTKIKDKNKILKAAREKQK